LGKRWREAEGETGTGKERDGDEGTGEEKEQRRGVLYRHFFFTTSKSDNEHRGVNSQIT